MRLFRCGLLGLLLFFLVNMGWATGYSSSYDVVKVYEGVELADGAKVLDNYGNVSEATMVLVSTRLDEEVYEISLTRKGPNLYKVEGTSLYIETRHCSEYAYSETVILEYGGGYRYTEEGFQLMAVLIFD